MPSLAPRADELADTARASDQMADRMQLLIEKRQELLADISHELRSPLTRISAAREQEHAGGGLGLSISRRVAELHGGSITVANRTDASRLEVRLRFAC